ncbi:recombinase family protein [Streptomyces sp. WG-D5]
MAARKRAEDPAAVPPPLVLDSYAREDPRRGSRRPLGVPGQHEANGRCVARFRAPGGRTARPGLELHDQGRGAWDAGARREGWETLIDRLASGACDGVVLFDLERLLRQPDDAARLADLAEQGAVVLDSDGAHDLTTPAGLRTFRDAVSAARYYSDRLSTRTRRGLGQRIARGVAKPGRYRAFGFEADANTVREAEAEVIRALMAAALAGERLTDLAEGLNERGLRTTTDGPWTPQTVRHLLKNPRIAGHITVRGEIVGAFPVEDEDGRPTGHPIVAPADWERLCRLVAGRRGAPPRTYLLTGTRSVVCGNCGGLLRGKPSQNGRSYPDGEEMRKYECVAGAGAQGRGCGKTLGDQRELDRFVSALVVRRLSDPAHVDRLRRRAGRLAEERVPHERELARLAALVDYWDEQLNEGRITIDRRNRLVADVTARTEREEAALAALGRIPDAPVAEVVENAGEKWEAADHRERRSLVQKAFQGYYVAIDPGPLADLDFRGRVHVLTDDRPIRPRRQG